MLDQLMQFVKVQLGDKLKDDKHLDDNQRDEVFNLAQGGLMETIKGQLRNGNVSSLLNMFNGGDDPNDDSKPVTSSAKSNVVSSLMDKLGLDEGMAGATAAQALPVIMNRFTSKDTGHAADAGDLVKQIGLWTAIREFRISSPTSLGQAALEIC